jgi:hypothetical protein
LHLGAYTGEQPIYAGCSTRNNSQRSAVEIAVQHPTPLVEQNAKLQIRKKWVKKIISFAKRMFAYEQICRIRMMNIPFLFCGMILIRIFDT